MSIKINGVEIGIPGPAGKSAYQAAKDAGFTGSETEFNQSMASVKDKQNKLSGTKGQIIGFDDNGDAVAQSKPTYTASEVGALPSSTSIPSKTSQLTNDSGFITGYTETDPTVPSWAKAPSKPTYTASEVGADASGSASQALAYAKSYTDKQIAAIPTPDVSGQINTHNTNTKAHNDIRELIIGLTNRMNALADSDDTTLDQLSEIVAYIKNNKSLIDGITTSKVNVADIIDNLTTNVSDKPLSAAQGVALKALIDAITVPKKVSELENDSGYLTSYTETDPTVPAWAKAASKPSYTKGEVGLGNVDNVKQYSASNPPPYPVTSVNGQTGAVTVKPKRITVTLTAAGWDSTAKTQTVTVTGVSATETDQMITPTPALASQSAYYDAGILCTGQAADSLTFTCKTVPTADLTVYVVIQTM